MEREEFERPQRARKNTHKWCRGKVGKLHQLRRIKWTERPNSPGNPGAGRESRRYPALAAKVEEIIREHYEAQARAISDSRFTISDSEGRGARAG